MNTSEIDNETRQLIKDQIDPKAKKGYIYVLKSGDYYKIGRTEKLFERTEQIKIQLPFKAILQRAYYVNDIVKMEKMIHSFLKEKRTNGEWFKLDLDDLILFENLCRGDNGVYEDYEQIIEFEKKHG